MTDFLKTLTHQKVRLFLGSPWHGDSAELEKTIPEENVIPYRIKRIPVCQWHLTWLFLGHVDLERVAEIQGVVSQCLTLQPQILAQVQSPIWWPQHNQPTAIACPVRSNPDALTPLFHTLSQALESVTSARNKRFTPHLTIARLKQFPGEKAQSLRVDLSRIESKSWLITEINLYQSSLASDGSHYQVLRKFPFVYS